MRSVGVTGSPSSCERSAIIRTAFSTTMTAPSTIRPKSIAPSDIRLPETPKRRMPMNATSIESGITRRDDQAGAQVPEHAGTGRR